jgi:galactoside O-acetyltransferase
MFCGSNSIPKTKEILFKDSYTHGDIVLGNNIFIGAQCIILPNTAIEDNVVIASNSTVKGRLESGYLYGGNPAKRIKEIKYE